MREQRAKLEENINHHWAGQTYLHIGFDYRTLSLDHDSHNKTYLEKMYQNFLKGGNLLEAIGSDEAAPGFSFACSAAFALYNVTNHFPWMEKSFKCGVKSVKLKSISDPNLHVTYDRLASKAISISKRFEKKPKAQKYLRKAVQLLREYNERTGTTHFESQITYLRELMKPYKSR